LKQHGLPKVPHLYGIVRDMAEALKVISISWVRTDWIPPPKRWGGTRAGAMQPGIGRKTHSGALGRLPIDGRKQCTQKVIIVGPQGIGQGENGIGFFREGGAELWLRKSLKA